MGDYGVGFYYYIVVGGVDMIEKVCLGVMGYLVGIVVVFVGIELKGVYVFGLMWFWFYDDGDVVVGFFSGK